MCSEHTGAAIDCWVVGSVMLYAWPMARLGKPLGWLLSSIVCLQWVVPFVHMPVSCLGMRALVQPQGWARTICLDDEGSVSKIDMFHGLPSLPVFLLWNQAAPCSRRLQHVAPPPHRSSYHMPFFVVCHIIFSLCHLRTYIGVLAGSHSPLIASYVTDSTFACKYILYALYT